MKPAFTGAAPRLGARYAHGIGRPPRRLNRLQAATVRAIESRIDSGEYPLEEVPCPVCGERDLELLASQDRYGLRLSTAICRLCGLVQSNPRMAATAYARFYVSDYRPLYMGEAAPSAEHFARRRDHGRTIFEFIGGAGWASQSRRVLEVGCSSGGIVSFFRDEGCTVRGLDPTPDYVTFGVKHHGLDLSVGTIDDLDPDAQYDLVIYCHVLEHLTEPVRDLKRIAEHLAPGGVLYLEVPGLKNLASSYRHDFLRLLQNAHTYVFTLTTLQNLCATAGLRVLEGDETIRALVQPAAGLPSRRVNDCSAALHYLDSIEPLRRRAALAHGVKDTVGRVSGLIRAASRRAFGP